MAGMLSNLSERDRGALRNLAIGVGGIVVFMVAVDPLMNQWKDLNAKIEDGEKKIAAIQTRVNDAVEAKQTMDKLKVQATLHQSSATLQRQSPQLLTQVGMLPSYQQLNVARLEPLPVGLVGKNSFYRSGVTIQFSSSLNELHRFLADAEKAVPALKVERLSLAQDNKRPGIVIGQMVVAGYAVVVKKSAS